MPIHHLLVLLCRVVVVGVMAGVVGGAVIVGDNGVMVGWWQGDGGQYLRSNVSLTIIFLRNIQ